VFLNQINEGTDDDLDAETIFDDRELKDLVDDPELQKLQDRMLSFLIYKKKIFQNFSAYLLLTPSRT